MTSVKTLLLATTCAFLALSPVKASALQAGSAGADPGLAISALYQPQSIVGTTTEGYAWAADGSVVTFLWNDQGRTFRDVWSYDPATGERQRLTHLGDNRPVDDAHPGVSAAVPMAGGRVAFVLNGSLNLRDANGTVSAVETDKSAVRQLALSPDGRSLSFVSGGAADSRADRYLPGSGLWVRAADATADSASRNLVTYDDPKVYVGEYRWADDAKSVAFVKTDNRPITERDIYYYAHGDLQNNRVSRAFPGEETTLFTVGVVDAAGGEARYFERPDAHHHVWGYGLSSDGGRLFVNSSDMLADDHTIYVYDVKTGASEVFYNEYDAKHVRPDWKVEWAPKDDGLIILTDREGYLHLYHQTAAGAAPRRLTTGEWEISEFAVDKANSQIYFVSNQAHLAERHVYRVALNGGPVERLTAAEAGSHTPVYAPDFRSIASTYSNDQMPPELVVIDTARPGTQTQVTQSPRPEFYAQTWAPIRYVMFNSHIDGAPLLGRMTLPRDFDESKTYPLIVGSVYSDAVRNQWGGRRAHPTWGLDQHLADQGYIVMNVNLRGSWGQGRAHTQAMHHDYGGIDIDDIESGVRHLVAEGLVDPKRVGLWGSSYGGLMTLMSLSKKPGVYAAGIAGAPATNVWHAYPSQMWIMGPAEGDDMPERYERQSALYQNHGIVDPVMIIHGTRDQVVLYSDTVAFTERMIGNEQPFELVTLPGASHSWATDNLPQTRFAFSKMIEFFNRHLKPEATEVQP